MAPAPSKPLYRHVRDYVHERIVNGDYAADQRLPTDGQLMRRFSTTRATVAKAMQELERMGLIQRRPGAGSFVRPAAFAKGAFVATVIAGRGDDEFFAPICAQIAQACQASNLALLWGAASPATSADAGTSAERLCAQLLRQQVRGVFLVPDELPDDDAEDRNATLVRTLTAAGIVVVLLDRDIAPFPEDGPHDLVGIDNMNAGYQQTRHLLACGCRRIVYATRPGRLWTKAARIAGYRLALQQAGLPFQPEHVCAGRTADPAFADMILDLKPDGIVCFHDPIAAHLSRRLEELHIPVPGAIRIIGLDDVRSAHAPSVPLTTLQQPCRSIAAQAADLMARRLNRDPSPPRRVLFGTQLIIRASSRPALSL